MHGGVTPTILEMLPGRQKLPAGAPRHHGPPARALTCTARIRPTEPGSPKVLRVPSSHAVSREAWPCSKVWHLLPLNKRTPQKKVAPMTCHQDITLKLVLGQGPTVTHRQACALHGSKHQARPTYQATH